MPKYIDADEIPYATEKRITYKVLIDEMPESIVRCKDCKYKGESKDGYPMCMLFTKTKVFVELDHYCRKGERRESE